MSSKKVIESMMDNLQEFNKIMENSGLNNFQSFVLGFVCGLDSDTDNLQEQIKMMKELCYNQNGEESNNKSSSKKQQSEQKLNERRIQEEEEFEATPPLDDLENKQQKIDQVMTAEKSKPPSKGSGYLMSLQKKNHKDGESSNKMYQDQQMVSQNKEVVNRVEKQDSFDMNEYMKQFQDNNDDEQKTLDLIRQLQEEDNQNKQMRMQEDDDIDCPICMCELYTESVLALENCDHVFHKECLLEYIKNKISDRKALVVCPDESCKSEIQVDDFKHLLGKEAYENYIQYSLQSYVDEHGDEMSWCPTPDCKYVFAYDENEDEAFFKCLMCKKQYCLKCRVAYHDGMSCKEFQISNKRDENDEKFEKFVKGKKFKQCIKCKFWVEKNDGCDHMTCRCKYEFCYKCGGKYRECECVQKFQQQQQRRIEQRQQRKQKQAQKAAAVAVGGVRGRPRGGRRAQK